MQTAGKDAIERDFYVERDYYVECGHVVFTEAFLLRQGKCCGNGCRHCPYRGKGFRGESLATDAHGYALIEIKS